jgi:WhiB family redox-sensing transcriptional regulator
MTAVIALLNVDLADLEPWEPDALCADLRVAGTVTFYPDLGGSGEPAKALCRRCEVRAECLSFALGHMDSVESVAYWGIWGGTDERERRKMYRAQRASGLEAAA